MAPQQPTPSRSLSNGVQVVTLTVFSTGSAGSTGVPASSGGGGGSSVPIGAIVGGAAAGVILAVALVLVWKYWGLVIKRTDRRKRKEAQAILTVRENTRRNAATRFKPQSPLHPILRLDPEGRRVKFLNRTPTLTRGKNSNGNTGVPEAIPPTAEKETVAQETRAAADPGPTTGDDSPQQPSLRFAPASEPRLVYEPWEPELKTESREQQPEAEKETSSHPRPPEPQPRPAPEPTTPKPILSTTSHDPSGRSNSPTPAPALTPNHSPSFRPSRSTRMRTPTRLPDAPPIPVRGARGHPARPSSSTLTPIPSGSQTSILPSRSPTASPRRPPSGLVTPSTSGSSVPPVRTAPPAAAAAGLSSSSSSSSSSFVSTSLPPPPASRLTWTGSPLHNSVLASDRPVIMPRAKNTQATSPPPSQPGSPLSTWAQLPALASSTSASASHVSAGNGEPSGQRGFPDSQRYDGHTTETTGENAQWVSPSSTPSAYSND